MPTLLKEKKFNDTIQNITFFIDKKNKDGLMKNIFIRDETVQDKSKTIIAKSGKLVKKNNKTLLKWYLYWDPWIEDKNIDLVACPLSKKVCSSGRKDCKM